MADDAIATIQATILPDEIAKPISATTTVHLLMQVINGITN